MDADVKGSKDGRTVRAERTRQALLDAHLALLEEGDVRPTAERIAERAGVSERSVFQHFPDREAFLAAVAVQQYDKAVRGREPVDASRPLSDRIDACVAERAQVYERFTPVLRAAILSENESDVVAGWMLTARRAAAAEVERVFLRELERTEAGERTVLQAALVSALSWPVWDAYRVGQRLGVDRARAAMRVTLAALLRER